MAPSSSMKKKDVDDYIPLCRAIQMGDWEKAQEFFTEDRHALTDVLNMKGDTALHVAIGNPENTPFLEKLLEQLNPESLLTVLNENCQNALHYAAILNNHRAAKKLVEKNPNLLFSLYRCPGLPVVTAVTFCQRTTFLYLLQACKQHIGLSQKDGNQNPFEGEHGGLLIHYTILGRLFGCCI